MQDIDPRVWVITIDLAAVASPICATGDWLVVTTGMYWGANTRTSTYWGRSLLLGCATAVTSVPYKVDNSASIYNT